ncbi:MAG: isoleucine--tRNA ligase [Chloroflexi bacterium]|nr:isoleucine--tRNA ligase [Chloroflexota bacterium]
MFKPVDSKVDFPDLEKQIQLWWDNNKIVDQYLTRNKDASKTYSFIDGPITANNPMGVHHAWGRSYKDLFLRYKTMQGYEQRYQNGFDGQGLWIEVEVEKELGFHSKRDIEKYGVDKFVDLCKARVEKFANIITDQSKRLGYWMDWDNSYHTMSDENNYTIWHFLKKCHEKGWIYQGTDVMPWCPRCGTGLSEHEIVTEGYKEIVHPGLFIKLPIIGRDGEYLLIWTTTPWTLTSNIAAAVHPEKKYSKVRTEKGILYLIKGREQILNLEFEHIADLSGEELIGLEYKGPFDELPVQKGITHKVIAWEEVNEDEGTGIVHIAPGAGKDDFLLSKEHGFAVIAPLDEYGHFIEGFNDFTGMNVFDVKEKIFDSLKEKGFFYQVEQYPHRYPVCWRCDTELVFRLVDEWFISMDELREMISDSTRNVKWVPSFGLERELDWLRNMDDWMISKKRYWGLALPIYKCDCGNFEVIGSKDELESKSVSGWEKFEDKSPHRPWIDNVKIECSKCNQHISRITDVGNPWLDAGIVPFSTLKYAEDKEYWGKWFPADWISESFPGQFRNWFYSLLTMSTVLEISEPTKAIFSYAIMRDENGEEMHKSKGNAIWFEDAADKMGVDAMRWLYARQNPSANLAFGYGTVDEVRRQFIIPLWNIYSFFVTYANLDQFNTEVPAPSIVDRPEIDRWILSELNILIDDFINNLDNFQPDSAAKKAEKFIDNLSNWYVRRNRRRFWKSGLLSGIDSSIDTDKLSAYYTLYEVLIGICKLLAPIMPFITEAIYLNLSQNNNLQKDSIHLQDYPVCDKTKIDPELSNATSLAMKISSLGRSARSKASIKVRQPLDSIQVSLNTKTDEILMSRITSQIIDELNVKNINVIDDIEPVVNFEVKPNLNILGPKYGSDVQKIKNEILKHEPKSLYDLASSNQEINIGKYNLSPEDLLLNISAKEGYEIASDDGLIVVISTNISPEMLKEGVARELVHRIQNMRRSAGFNISDKISIYYKCDKDLSEIINEFDNYICRETLSLELTQEEISKEIYSENFKLNGSNILIGVKLNK